MTNALKKSSKPPTKEQLRTMEKAFMYVIETAPEKSYLALMIKPYIEEVNCDSLRILYTHLNSASDARRFLREDMRAVMWDCAINERLRNVIQEMIDRFHV